MAINRCLILGHDGFIGAHLCRHLAAQHPALAIEGLSLRQTDLADESAVELLTPKLGTGSAVVMLAAIKRQVGDNVQAYLRNMALCGTVARAFAANPADRLMFVSSAAVYGEDIAGDAITEDSPVTPRSFYGLAKASAEMLFRLVCRDDLASRLVLLRPATIFGPGEGTEAYGPAGFMAKAASGREITLWGDGSELREFVDVADACAIMSRLLLGPAHGTFNLVTGRSISFQAILHEIGALVGRPLDIKQKPRSKAKVDQQFDNRRLLDAIGGFAFRPMRASLETLL
jgi:UDP-glucose 4-epimerase